MTTPELVDQSAARVREAFIGLGPGLDDRRIVALATTLVGAGEVLSALGWVVGAAMLDAALIPVLLGRFAWGPRTRQGRLLPVIALVALLRVLSIVVAVPYLPVVTWYATVGLALLVGEVLAMRFVEAAGERLRLVIKRPGLDLAVAATGIPAGLVGAVLLRDSPLLVPAGSSTLAIGAAIITLVLFAALPEELLFRGLLQSLGGEAFESPRAGLVYAAGLSAVMYLGAGSILYTVAIGAYGLFLGAAVLRGGSIWGTTASHGIALVGMAIVWPALLGRT